jgi:hypothetical protein
MTEEIEAVTESADATEEIDHGIVFDDGEDESADEPVQAEADSDEGETEGDEPEEDENKVIFSPEQQEVFNREIGKKVAKEKEAQRQIDDYKAKLNAYEQKQNPQPNRVDLPDYPDKYEDNFQQKLEDYNKAVSHNANMDFQERLMTQAKATAEAKQQAESKEKQTNVINMFTDNATKAKISEADLSASLDLAAAFNLDVGLREYMMQDALGPQIVVALASDPANLEAFAAMSPLQAVAHIESKIKPSINNKVGKRPPPPPKHLKGKGAAEGDGGVPGVTYE